jgi:hypothetical protein
MSSRYPSSSNFAQKFINFYHRYENLNLKITFILISLQIIHLYWLTSDVVLQKIYGESFFIVPKTFLPLFVLIDYIEIPALLSGIIFYTYNIRTSKGDSKRSYLFLALLVVQVFHIFWITDDVVYASFFESSFVNIPPILAWVAILIDYLELPVMADLLYKIIRKKQYNKNRL